MRKLLICAAAAALLPIGSAMAQTSPPPASPSPAPSATIPAPAAPAAAPSQAGAMTLTEAEAKAWIGRPVYSSDSKKLGEVAAFKRGADNKVMELHADIGGLLGLGQTRVMVSPAQFKLANDRVILTLSETQTDTLPKIEKK